MRQALEHLLQHHEPYPALVMDRQWNLLMTNAAAQRMVTLRRAGCSMATHLRRRPAQPDETDPASGGSRTAIVNPDEVAATMLAHLERDAIDSAASAALLDELIQDYALAPRWQQVPDRSPAPVLATHFRISEIDLRLFGIISTFGTPQELTTDELRVETMFPADSASYAPLRAWAGRVTY